MITSSLQLYPGGIGEMAPYAHSSVPEPARYPWTRKYKSWLVRLTARISRTGASTSSPENVTASSRHNVYSQAHHQLALLAG